MLDSRFHTSAFKGCRESWDAADSRYSILRQRNGVILRTNAHCKPFTEMRFAFGIPQGIYGSGGHVRGRESH